MHIGGNRQEAEVVLINEVECTNIPTAIFRMHEHGQGNVTAVEWNMNRENIRTSRVQQLEAICIKGQTTL